MRNHISSYTFVLVILLRLSLANATLLQKRDVLRTSLKYTAQTLPNGPVKPDTWAHPDTYAEPDTWADPDRSFKHLPTKCPSSPPGAREADKIRALPGQPPRVNFDQ
jgi:serine carboxypeptidase-like clade 2